MSSGAANVVEILVKSTDDTADGFAASKAGAEGAAEGVDTYAEAEERAAAAEEEFRAAQAQAAEAQAQLDGLQQSGAASADELAAAQGRVTETSLASLDAQLKLGQADLEVAAAAKASGDASEEAGAKTDASGGLMAGAGSKMKMAALGVAVGLGLAVKGAADFQQQTVKLVTSAGESASKLGMVQQGILALSASTDTSTEQLASGMYMVESAGFHGANGLTVLKAAAQGAKAEGADLGEVANAVTSGLNAYGLSASHATSFTDMMVTAVGQGKMTMQDLASSISAVLPIAASAHISFQQVGGAIATMTSMGMSARQASQDLANMIRSLISPSATSSAEMKALGLNANVVSQQLGKVGLTGTMQTLTEAILKNTSGGNVLLGYMKEMSPQAQGFARQILAGTISTNDLRTAVKGLNPEQAKLISLFETSATSATGLKQTFDGAMKEMTGGATGLNVALMLGGQHAATFNGNVKAIADSAKGTGKDVKGWGDIQKETNFQLGSAEKAVKAMGDSLGLALLPTVTAVLHPLTAFLGLIASNRAASIALAAVLGSVLAGALGMKLASVLSDAKAGFSGLLDVLTGLPEKLSGLASGMSSMASSVASFASETVSQLGRAAVATGVWIAEHAVAATSFIAENVMMAASATAAFVAENLATLGIVAGIALLVAGIVFLAMHWKQVWADVKAVALDAWHFLDDQLIHPFMAGIDVMVGWVKSHFQLLAEIIATVLLGPAGFLIAFIATHWAEFRQLTSELVDDVTGFFERLPGRIMGAIAALPGELFSFGAHIISMLASGIESEIGSVTSAIGGIAGEILDHIPHSPAKKGPLSGSGDPQLAGRKIGLMLAEGMAGSTSAVTAAAAHLAGGAAVGGRGVAGAGAGGQQITLQFAPSGGTGLDALFWTWLRNGVRVKGGTGPGSVQIALGQSR